MTPDENIDELRKALQAMTEHWISAVDETVRINARIAELRACSDADAEEMERLRSQLAEWEAHVKGAFEHFFPDRDFGQSPPWQRADMLVSHCHDLETENAALREEIKYLTHTDKPPYRAVEHRRKSK